MCEREREESVRVNESVCVRGASPNRKQVNNCQFFEVITVTLSASPAAAKNIDLSKTRIASF